MDVVTLFQIASTAKQDKRFPAFKELAQIAKTHPQDLDPIWSDLVGMLNDQKPDKAYIAVYLIGLVGASGDKKIIAAYDKYIAQLANPSIVVGPQVAKYLGKFAKAIPELEPKITDTLLHIDQVITARHRDLFKAYVLEGFAEYYTQSPRQQEILQFVKDQLKATSPKARKLAKLLLAKQ